MAQNTPDLDNLPETPGVSQKKIVALDNAISAWRDLVEKRMALNEKKVVARDRVLEVCHDKGVTAYRYRDGDTDKMLVVTAGKDKVKLKAMDEVEESGSED